MSRMRASSSRRCCCCSPCACSDDVETSKLLSGRGRHRPGEGGRRALWLRLLPHDPLDPRRGRPGRAAAGPDREPDVYRRASWKTRPRTWSDGSRTRPGSIRLTAMPNLRVTDADARDIAAFLSTLR